MSSWYQLIFKTDVNPQITVAEVPSGRLIDPELETLCQAGWQKMLAEAKEKNKILYDSEIYRLESAELRKNRLGLKISVIPYSIRLEMNNHIELVKKLGLEYASRGMYTSCFVITADNKYLFIEKSGNYMTNRKYAFVGGVLSKSERVIGNGEDLFKTVSTEVLEELEVPEEEIKDITLKAGFISENYNVCLLFIVNLKQVFAEIEKNFRGGKESETEKIIGVDADKLKEFTKILPEKDWPKFEIAGLI